MNNISLELFCPERQGNTVAKDVLRDMLTNCFYYGLVKWGKDKRGRQQYFQGKHEPLIKKELFDKVQTMMLNKSTLHHKRKREFNFTGLMRCKYCGSSITAEISKGVRIYYYCTKWKAEKLGKKCLQKMIREEKVSEIFLKEIQKFHIDKDIEKWLVEGLKNSHESEKEYVKRELSRLKKKSSMKQNEQHTLYDDRVRGVITEEFFKSRFNKINEEKTEVDNEIQRLKKVDVNYLKQGIEFVNWIKNLPEKYQEITDPKERNTLLKILIDKAYLKDDKVIIKWYPAFEILFQPQNKQLFSYK